MTHPTAVREAAFYLVELGLNDCQVGRTLEISRGTIRDWRRGRLPNGRSSHDRCSRCSGGHLDEEAYAYLLGIYLGDGCITVEPRCEKLRIALDARYPQIISETEWAIRAVAGCKVNRVRKIGAYEVCGHWTHWSCVFPQHGPGRKHERQIELAIWQRGIVERQPRPFLRGLIHSDGWRGTNVIRVPSGKVYRYGRYEFTNRSQDIRGLFAWACGLVGVTSKKTTEWRCAISKRADVELLDTFIGPKS